MAIDVAAESEAHVEALGRFEGDAGGDGHAVAAVVFYSVTDGLAREVGQLIAGFAIVAEELVVPSDGGVGLPLRTVVAIQGFWLAAQTVA